MREYLIVFQQWTENGQKGRLQCPISTRLFTLVDILGGILIAALHHTLLEHCNTHVNKYIAYLHSSTRIYTSLY